MTDTNDDKLLRDAANLSRSIPPERDLWPGIEAAIEQPKRGGDSPSWLYQAAAVVLLVVGSSGVTYITLKSEEPTSVVAPEDLFYERAAFGSSYSLGPGFTDARGGLAAKLEAQLDRLPPEDRAEIEQNLRLIRDAIDEINAELAKDPGNAQLQALLLKTYREELTLMRRIGDLTQSVISRNDI
ncbi:MAG: hypothetical protein AAF917_03530 [Pseudomonadota bacterium]